MRSMTPVIGSTEGLSYEESTVTNFRSLLLQDSFELKSDLVTDFESLV
mgnify:CR=1 FL=1